MHELSIAQSIVESVLKEADKNNYTNVLTIALRIGALTDIVPDALLFGFDIIKADTILGNTKLVIELVPVKGKCNNCKIEFEVKEYVFVCPACSSFNIKTEKGTELDIAYIEIDD